MANSFRFFFLLVAVSFTSCQDSRYEVETNTNIEQADFYRLDQAIFAESTGTLADLATLDTESNGFLTIYMLEIMQMPPIDNPMATSILSQFTEDPTWRDLQQHIQNVHPELQKESATMKSALARYAAFFKENTLPQLVTYNSGFNVGVYPSDQYLGVGLEWYSGSDQPILDRLPPELFPQYKRDKMLSKYLVGNALKGWLFVKFQSKQNGESLLNRMVFSGKIHFLTKILLEDISDADLLNYSEVQAEWAENNAYDVWKHLVESDLVFSKSAKEVSKMMNDGPFTPGMPPESPGGIGNWVGYKMVEAFMEKNSDIGLVELMNNKNDQNFLKYYKPGR